MYYPEITNVDNVTTTLKLLVRKLEEDPNYLNHPDCPYPSDFIDFIESTLPNVSDPSVESISEDEEIDIAREATVLFNDMKAFKKDLQSGDIAEKASMFRTLTSLMEKLINVRERASAVKNFEAFEHIIFETIDSYLSPQQRTEFLDRLAEIKT